MQITNAQEASPVVLDGYESGHAVILTTDSRGEGSPNAVFAQELVAAFDALGVPIRSYDYTRDVRQVSSAIADPDCLFFVCFNGFGSELLLTSGTAGYLISAFEHYRKPVFDLVSDCPVHEDMRHQIESTGPMRNVMITDYTYACLSRLAGTRNVRTVPGIAFPAAVGHAAKPLAERSIDVLLPIDALHPDPIRARHEGNNTHKGRTYREIFDSVVEYALSDFSVDALIETLVACQELGIAADLKSSEFRFLLSSIIDYVDARRQGMLLDAIRHLPVAVSGDAALQGHPAYSRFRFFGDGSFPSLLQTMADSKTVVCPLTRRRSRRERAMAAFTAGALVVASADEVLESQFVDGADMLTYRNPNELALVLEHLLGAPHASQRVATSGQAKVNADFSPRRLASMILALAKRPLWPGSAH